MALILQILMILNNNIALIKKVTSRNLPNDYDTWMDLNSRHIGNNELIEMDDDPEITEMAKMENEEIKEENSSLGEAIKIKLVPKDPEDSKNAIIEIRAGTGGDEAAIFAGDLFDMYQLQTLKVGK